MCRLVCDTHTFNAIVVRHRNTVLLKDRYAILEKETTTIKHDTLTLPYNFIIIIIIDGKKTTFYIL